MNPGLGITIWDVASKKPGIMMPLDTETEVASLAFLDDDRTLPATTMRRTGADLESPWVYGVVRWDTVTGERRDAEDFGRHPLTLTLSPNGRYGVVRGVDKKSLHDFKAGGEPLDLGSFTKDFAFAADGSTLVVYDRGSISFLEIPSGRERRRVAVDPYFDRAVGSFVLALSSDTRLLAVGGYPDPQSAALINLTTGKVLGSVTCGPPLSICRSVRLSPDGHTLATNTYAVNLNDQRIPPDLKLWKIPAAW